MKLEWNSCFRAGITVVITYLVIHYWHLVANISLIALGAAVPLFLGFVVAYTLNIPMSFFEKHLSFAKCPKLKRPVCMLLALAIIILVFALVLGTILPELVACVQLLLDRLPAAIARILIWVEDVLQWDVPQELVTANLATIDWENLISTAANWLMNGIGGTMNSIISAVSTTFSALVTSVLCLVFAIYLLAGKERLAHQLNTLIHTYFGGKISHRVNYVLSTADNTFHHFVVGQCMEAVILGGLCILGMWIFRFPYATMIGTLVGFTALIPVAGAYIGAAVGALMIMTVSPGQAVLFLIFLVVLQQLEGDLIYPKVVGSSIGLPGLWVMVAVTVGGGIMGILGMLIGVPLAATLYQLVRNDVMKRRAASTTAEPPAEG